MRFGTVLWLDGNHDPGEIRWFPKKKRLELRLSPHSASFFGEVAEARFESLAASLDAQTDVKILKR